MNRPCLLLTFLVLFPAFADAKTDTLYASITYTLGDNDSRNDAKRMAFMEAKRKLIEKAGVYIESETTLTNLQLDKDQIRSFSAAVLKIEVEQEEFQVTHGSQILYMTVKALVDTDDVERALGKIKEDKSLQKRIVKQQQQLVEMEEKVKTLQQQLTKTEPEQALQLRKERNILFEQMSETEKITFNIQATTRKAAENVKKGMTKSEVEKVAGYPRSEGYGLHEISCYNYGYVWVIFRNGLVIGFVNADKFTDCWEFSGLR
jgi:hypothetical protein